jgi:hypothetical protein
MIFSANVLKSTYTVDFRTFAGLGCLEGMVG